MPQSDKAVAMVTSCYGDLVCVSNLCTKLRTYNIINIVFHWLDYMQ